MERRERRPYPLTGGEKAAGMPWLPPPHPRGRQALSLPISSKLRLWDGPEAEPLGWLPLLFSPGMKANLLPPLALLACLFFVPRIAPRVPLGADGLDGPWV